MAAPVARPAGVTAISGQVSRVPAEGDHGTAGRRMLACRAVTAVPRRAHGERAVADPVRTRGRVAFIGGLHVGIETHFKNVAAAAEAQGDVELLAIPVASYRRDRIDRLLPFLPMSTRGTLRYLVGTGPLFEMGHVDAVWSLLDIPLLPWMLSGGRRIPVAYASDSTPRQLRAFGAHYHYWGGRSALKFGLRQAVYRRFLRRVAVVLAWSEWAAQSFREDYGVPGERVHVMPPGVDTAWWTPLEGPPHEGPPRLLFVSGDFLRQGGDLLLDVFRARLRGRAELDMVTRADTVEPEPGLRVHTGLSPNDDRLRLLSRRADLLVIPTRADCFSIAGLEAMACGVPVVTCPVGGVGEVFEDGLQGRYVPPDDAAALGRALESLLDDPARRRAMGRAARELAVERYDAASNARRLLALLLDLSRA